MRQTSRGSEALLVALAGLCGVLAGVVWWSSLSGPRAVRWAAYGFLAGLAGVSLYRAGVRRGRTGVVSAVLDDSGTEASGTEEEADAKMLLQKFLDEHQRWRGTPPKKKDAATGVR